MKQKEHYIYSEQDYGIIEGPFVFHQNKWSRSIQKRVTAIRKLFSQPPGRIRERIAEYPYTIGAMAKLPKGSKVADLGGASSVLGLELVYLEHEVHVLDLRPCPLKHPKLFSQQIDILNNDLPDNSFDAISCISVIEHVGIARYGGLERADGDFAMMFEINRLLKPNGTLILSAPYGIGHDPLVDGKPKGFRIYNSTRLEKLTELYKIEDLRFLVVESGIWLKKEQAIADTVLTSRPVECIFLAQLQAQK